VPLGFMKSGERRFSGTRKNEGEKKDRKRERERERGGGIERERKYCEKRLRCETTKDSSVLRRPVGLEMGLKTVVA